MACPRHAGGLPALCDHPGGPGQQPLRGRLIRLRQRLGRRLGRVGARRQFVSVACRGDRSRLDRALGLRRIRDCRHIADHDLGRATSFLFSYTSATTPTTTLISLRDVGHAPAHATFGHVLPKVSGFFSVPTASILDLERPQEFR